MEERTRKKGWHQRVLAPSTICPYSFCGTVARRKTQWAGNSTSRRLRFVYFALIPSLQFPAMFWIEHVSIMSLFPPFPPGPGKAMWTVALACACQAPRTSASARTMPVPADMMSPPFHLQHSQPCRGCRWTLYPTRYPLPQLMISLAQVVHLIIELGA